MANILVVEDDVLVGELLCTILRSQDHKVKYVSDGEEALALLDNNIPDLIITDIVMPNMNGLTLIRNIKDKYPNLNLIAISGGGRDGPEDYLTSAEQYGATAVFSKPFIKDDVLNTVNQIIYKA